MPEMPSASYKTRQEELEKQEKHVEKVVTGKVTVKKQTLGDKVANVFLKEDMSSIKKYIIYELLIPGIKETVLNSLSMAFFGDARYKRPGAPSQTTIYRSQTPYVSYSNQGQPQRAANTTSTMDARYQDNVILETRQDAEHVMDQMIEILNRWGQVRVADLCELVGMPSEYTDNRYGWTDLRGADIQRVRDGWMLKLPKSYPLNRN
jgi:hypothetical protein